MLSRRKGVELIGRCISGVYKAYVCECDVVGMGTMHTWENIHGKTYKRVALESMEGDKKKHEIQSIIIGGSA